MRITVLAENTSRCGLPCEHGLSLWIETESGKILFDSGQGELFAENAARLGIDLNEAEFAVLSHGHYDHGGGLKTFLRQNEKAKIYMSKYAFEPHYNADEKYIGLDSALAESDRIVLTDGVTEIADGMTLFSCGDRVTVADIDAAGLKIKVGGGLLPEDFRHEHYLLIEENGRSILFSGCSHRGVINIVEWFNPDVMIGGFHLMKRRLDGALIDCAKKLDAYETEYYTCHCTGAEQYDYMKPYMRRLHYASTGDVIVL